MTDYPGFGVLLTRLLTHRGTDVAALSSVSAVPEAELGSVLAGGQVSSAQLRALAPALGLHTADLFVIAGASVPEDLTPLDREAGPDVARIVDLVLALPSEQRACIHRSVDDLPQEPRPQPDPSKKTRVYDVESAGFGAMLLTMLCSNRNLHSPVATAKTVAMMTRGGMYLSAATYPMIGGGREKLRPEWVRGLATVLGIPAGDLAAIIGIELSDAPVREDPIAAETAELIWKLRRLSAAQSKHVYEQAESMLVPIPEGAAEDQWNRIFHVQGVWWGAPKEH